MKKVICGFVILVLILVLSFSSINEVKALDYNSHDHIYHVSSVNVNTTSGMLSIEGFAYIMHMDNYGGNNLKTWIIVTNGSIEKHYEVSYKDNSGFDYYYALCQESASGEGSDYCETSHAEMIRDSNLRRNVCNFSNRADCAYFGVDFDVNIDLIALFQELGEDSDISFKIKTYNEIDNTEVTSDFGVVSQVCKVDDIPGLCSDEIKIGNSSITFKDVSDKVKVVVTSGRAKIYDPTKDTSSLSSVKRYYVTGLSYKVSKYQSKSPFKSGYGNYFNANYFVVTGTDGNSVIPGGTTQYIIYDSWVRAERAMKISFDLDGSGPTYTPPDGACDPGYTEVYASKTAICGAGQQDFQACVRKGIKVRNATYTLSETEYREATRNYKEKACGTDGDYSRNVTFDIDADILIHQGGTFIFNGISESVIYAGRGFSFPSITYNNDIYWKSAGDWNTAKIGITYGEWEDRGWDEETDTCIRTESKTIKNTVRERCPASGVASNGQYCRKGSWVNIEIETVVNECVEYEVIHHEKWVCNPNANTTYVSYSNYLSQLNREAIETVNNNVSFGNIQGSIPVSYDSNVVSSTEKDVAGSWETVFAVNNYHSHNSKYSTKYEFVMDDAYVKLVGDDIGNVKYSKSSIPNYQNVGKKYYVPLLFPNNRIFPLNIKQNNISLVSGINWYLDGTCYIVPVNTVFDCDNNNCISKIRYRPIDLSNPFPKGVIPYNWQGWYSNDTNKKRIANTYDNGFKYSVTLVRGSSINGKLGIDEINAIDTDYNSWSGMNTNGTSSFINNNSSYFAKPSSNSWCEIGKFDASCDK